MLDNKKAMKRTILVVSILLISLGCKSQSYKREKFKGGEPEKNYTLQVLATQKVNYLVGGHNEREKQFIYPDSSKLYVSTFFCSLLNYDNILKLDNSVSKKRLTDASQFESPLASKKTDTLVVEGSTANNLYWKDVRIGKISVGYVNVPAEKREEFDKMLLSLRGKK